MRALSLFWMEGFDLGWDNESSFWMERGLMKILDNESCFDEDFG